MFDFGGRQLHVDVRGTGRPVVVPEAGGRLVAKLFAKLAGVRGRDAS